MKKLVLLVAIFTIATITTVGSTRAMAGEVTAGVVGASATGTIIGLATTAIQEINHGHNPTDSTVPHGGHNKCVTVGDVMKEVDSFVSDGKDVVAASLNNKGKKAAKKVHSKLLLASKNVKLN